MKITQEILDQLRQEEAKLKSEHDAAYKEWCAFRDDPAYDRYFVVQRKWLDLGDRLKGITELIRTLTQDEA